MPRTTVLVVGTALTIADEGGEIVVGTLAWYDWLEGAVTFAFSGQQGHFTARKEQRGAISWYWKAYRRHSGKLYSAYLGKSEDLSIERLTAVAQDLTARGASGAPAASSRQPGRAATRRTTRTQPQVSNTVGADVTDSLPLADLLLTTKLSVPALTPTLVSRPSLVARLNHGLAGPNGKLTTVTAPAGWGKTTLLSAWCSDLSGPHQDEKWPRGPGPPGARIAWVTLDGADNDPIRFWTNIIFALNTLYADAGNASLALLRSPQPPPIETVLTTLVNALAPLASLVSPDSVTSPRAVLVLDDYHLIDAQPIHGALTFLLENLPAHLHLVIASRAGPPLPLARLRARGALTELLAADLRFTPQEAATFLEEIVGFRLSPEDVAALDERTEGWIAGLQLAALAMKDRADITSFISGFTGTSRFVMDYLAEEVLERQTEEVRTFLLRTSILESMCAPLCDSVLGVDTRRAGSPASESHTMLEKLEHSSLFIVALDDEHIWYRYHHLFAGVLRARLRQKQPDILPALYRRAAEWCEARELVPPCRHSRTQPCTPNWRAGRICRPDRAGRGAC